MRRPFALVAMTALTLASAAQAETFKAYSTISPKSLQWSYDSDYAYRDARTNRVVVLQAIGKVGATPRLGPSGPGAPDGVGSVVAIDCKARSIVLLGSYAPSKALVIDENWRSTKTKGIEAGDDRDLMTAVCPGAAQLPAK